uniref:Uncharacterized protein n=1 Tax=Rhizophora mucronata TaxID=61149 RepID=A0A2P2N8P8_RHIMU
MYLSNFLRY